MTTKQRQARNPVLVDGGRERTMRAAYELFSRGGTRTIGVDAVVARAAVAKMTLYRHFPSKEDLVLAFLERREQLWTRQWLGEEVVRRETDPARRLLAIFDVFHEWFQTPEFEGCTFIQVLLEHTDVTNPVRLATVANLENIRGFLRELGAAAGIADTDAFARQWHILMKGSIISALEGDTQAATRAKEMGVLVLQHRGISV
ncbi:MAG: TetR/AcrR family transcriptional regulator [Geodermatophilaceae bacterium]|nr:TetR/AcrR family transcriptional regulator [Geodermatophilaceae bacterium]